MATVPKSKPERKAKPEASETTFSLVSNEKLLAIYAAIVKCRMAQQRAAMLFQQGKLASDLHASSGHEAAAAAIAIDLEPRDSLGIPAGDWLPAMVKGLPLETLFRALALPSAGGIAGSLAAVAAQNNIVLSGDKLRWPETMRDHALAAQASKQGSVVCAVLPSNEQSLKPWHAILTESASQRLPIVFVHFADGIEQPRSEKSGRKNKNPAAFFHGVPAITVDALDAVAVYRVGYEAIVRARQGRGATLLECAAFAPPTPGDCHENDPPAAPSGPTDPVSTMEAYLKSKGIEPASHNRQIVTTFNLELDLATRFLDL